MPGKYLHKGMIFSLIVGIVLIPLLPINIQFASAQGKTPETYPPLTGIVAIAAETEGTACALTESGGVECWADGSGAENILNVQDAVALAAGGQHSCVITHSGGVQCWGYNSSGELGDGTTDYSFSSAVDVKKLPGEVTALGIGFDFTCVVIKGEVWCWGENTYGQLGDGTTTNSSVPVKVGGLTGEISAITAGVTHACALNTSGGVQCWGGNIGSVLGNSAIDAPSTPISINGLASGVTMITSRFDYSCALTESGKVICWGMNESGQLGNGETSWTSDLPVQVNGLPDNVSTITTGVNHTCALTTTGQVLCWGDNRAGELGDGTNMDRLAPVVVNGLKGNATAITAGRDYTCALVEGGIQCWGENNLDQLGTGIDPDSKIPVSVTGINSATVISAGGDTSCTLMDNGIVQCWGENLYGQVGDGTDTDRDTPVVVTGLPGNISELSVGYVHSCALTSNGVWCWGANYSGQLATKSVSSSSFTPVQATGLPSNIEAINAGSQSTCVLTDDGSLWCWGSNSGGQLGDGTTEDREIPGQVNGLTGRVTSFSVGWDYACAVVNGGVYCWGKNDDGQLGDGTTEDHLTPSAVRGLGNGISTVVAGEKHSCAITTEGEVKCWGYNINGQLGDGTTEQRLTPVDVTGLSGRVTTIGLGINFTCALLDNGGVKCWGDDSNVGNDTLNFGESLVPVDVIGLTSNVISIAAGRFHACAVLKDGSAQCWGTNWNGQLGNDIGPDSPTPLTVVLGPRNMQETDANKYREAGPLVPEITTYIPTPLDVSTRPNVIGTNLLLAAMMMLPFAVAAEFFTRTMSEHEEALRRRVKPVDWISRLKQRMDALAGTRLNRRPALIDTLKLLGVMLFYGLIFSLLDRTWNPFTVKGLILFLSMTIAYGIVGIADDIMQFRTIRKWGIPAELNLRPTNVFIAMLSTATSRFMTLVPGLMFGTPEALQTDEALFDQEKRNRLLKISALTFSVVGFGVWLSTIVTGLLQRQSLNETAGNLLGGLEGFLLVIFAVALENSFVQMLGFAGSFGQALKRKNRWLWLVVLVGVTFFFYHTLLNPDGELVDALEAGNIRLFLGVAAAFVVGTFGLRFYFQLQERRAVRLSKVATQPVESATRLEVPPAAPLPSGPVVAAPISTSASPKTLPAAQRQVKPVAQAMSVEPQQNPIFISINETKACPVCRNQIKAEAKVCRFCRATFTVTLRGYCLNDHDVVETSTNGKCARCGADVADMHVESRLLKAPAVLPATITQPVTAPVSNPAQAGTKTCPACGQIIKAEARICRFCRTRLESDSTEAQAIPRFQPKPQAEQPVKQPPPENYPPISTPSAVPVPIPRASADPQEYLVILHTGIPPTQSQTQELARAISAQDHLPVRVLSAIKTDRLPSGPDEYVITIALLTCDKNHIQFNSSRDTISFRPAIPALSGNPLGLITITVHPN